MHYELEQCIKENSSENKLNIRQSLAERAIKPFVIGQRHGCFQIPAMVLM
jgi:hypothetical protein